MSTLIAGFLLPEPRPLPDGSTATTGEVRVADENGLAVLTGPDGLIVNTTRDVFLRAVAAEFAVSVRPRQASDPHNGTPTFGQPEYTAQVEIETGYDDGPTLTEPDNVGWDLSGGARINYGRVDDDGPLMTTLNLSDYALQTGVVQRIVTTEQLVQHAMHLLRLAGATLTITIPATAPEITAAPAA